MKKIREWFNIQLIKKPGMVVLLGILVFNVIFLMVSALIISSLSLTGTEKMGFLEAAFCTITMILDAGCIQFVITDIGKAGVAIVLICLSIVLIGMISFTGAVIGYITNWISNFIENATSGDRKLKLTNHSVILNWNSRASEIVNDLLYCETKQKVVVLVNSRRAEIEREINERLADTVSNENAKVMEKSRNLPLIKRWIYRRKNFFKNGITVIVREGDVFSSKQLHDISVEHAQMVIILGSDIHNSVCKYERQEVSESQAKGNAQTIKTLMQVSDITSADYSEDNQKIIVEVTDDWTLDLVNKIIKKKQINGKCNIVPIKVNQVLGNILSQFSLMPELNLAYKELFSNKGATFFTRPSTVKDDKKYIAEFLSNNNTALPLTHMVNNGKEYFYYSTALEKDIDKKSEISDSDYKVTLNKNYWIERKNIVILGHNSRSDEIMKGFEAFRHEWKKDEEIIRIIVIDDKKQLEKMNYYKDYSFEIETQAAEIYDKDLICKTIVDFVDSNEEDTSVLILSDDSATADNIDARALANLVYVQDIIKNKKDADPEGFDEESIDVVVEIIDPKHHDIVNSYSVNNVVISNRYISKMITQIGEKEAIFDFYNDILTYDTGDDGKYESKEIYIKKVGRFFDKDHLPSKCTAEEFVRAVYFASIDKSIPEDKQNPTVVLGYVKPEGEMVLFSGDRSKQVVELTAKDKLVVFSNH